MQASGFIEWWSGWRERGGDGVRAALISISGRAAKSFSRIGDLLSHCFSVKLQGMMFGMIRSVMKLVIEAISEPTVAPT